MTKLSTAAAETSGGGKTAKSVMGLIMDEWTKELDVKEPVLETFLVRLSEMGLLELLPTGYALAEIVLRKEFTDSNDFSAPTRSNNNGEDEEDFMNRALGGEKRVRVRASSSRASSEGARYIREAVSSTS